MTLQTRLSTLITAIGADVKDIYSRLPGGTAENSVSATSYTFSASDAKRWTVFTSSGTITANISLDATLNLPIGTELNYRQGSTGAVEGTVSGGTRTSRGSRFKTNGAGAVVTAKKIAANSWLFYGDLVV